MIVNGKFDVLRQQEKFPAAVFLNNIPVHQNPVPEMEQLVPSSILE